MMTFLHCNKRLLFWIYFNIWASTFNPYESLLSTYQHITKLILIYLEGALAQPIHRFVPHALFFDSCVNLLHCTCLARATIDYKKHAPPQCVLTWWVQFGSMYTLQWILPRQLNNKKHLFMYLLTSGVK